MLIDSHAHLVSPPFEEDLEAILARARLAGVEAIVNICTNLDELDRGIELAHSNPWIYLAASTTPHDVEEKGEAHFDNMSQAAHSGKLVAVGETGLDYHYYPNTAPNQQLFLRRYLQLALACQLPIVIHCREAFSDLFKILDEEYLGAPGVLHCFTGTVEEAKEVIRRGWYLSLSGIITFKKSETLRAIARQVPLDQLLIETDAPYLAPHPFRGKRNEPSYLLETAKFIADLRGLSLQQIADATCQNARTLFRLD